MDKLLIFVSKKNKNYNFSLAVGTIKTKAKIFKETSFSSDEKSAVFELVKKFQEKGISFSEIILNGSENYFKGTLLEPYVSTLKKPELFFSDFIELKRAVAAARKVSSREHPETSLAESECPIRGCPESSLGSNSTDEVALGAQATVEPSRVEALGCGGCVSCGDQRPRLDLTRNAYESVEFEPKPPMQEMTDRKRARNSTAEPMPRATTKELGDRAENLVAEFLVREGHKIIARNFKTKFYEIDIISNLADKIYFTEVKYRASEFRGSSLDMITKKKLKQMTFAAESFLEYRKDLKGKYSPLLAAASVSGEDFILNDWFIIT